METSLPDQQQPSGLVPVITGRASRLDLEVSTDEQPNAKCLPPEVTLHPIGSENFTAFRRLITNLLPIRYPERVYSTILNNPQNDSISRVASWNWPATTRAGKSNSVPTPQSQIIGAICCRIEPLGAAEQNSAGASRLYIQMLAVLSAFRENGVARALLDLVIRQAVEEHKIAYVYAHVWEANKEALTWYKNRGFDIEQTIKGYYRKLHPSGACIVLRKVSDTDTIPENKTT